MSLTRRKCSKLLAGAALLSVATVATNGLAGELSLTGEGSIKYTPDSARLQFTASAEHKQADQASRLVREKIAQWRTGIEPYQSQLNEYNDASLQLYSRTLPVQEPREEPERRTVATQSVSFSIDNLTLLNPLLEQAQTLGLDYELGQQQFYHSEEATMQQQALAAAIKDAQTRCEFAAQQLAMQCGKVKTLNINSGYRPVPMMMASEARSAKGSVSSIGAQQITASVNATFTLE